MPYKVRNKLENQAGVKWHPVVWRKIKDTVVVFVTVSSILFLDGPLVEERCLWADEVECGLASFSVANGGVDG